MTDGPEAGRAHLDALMYRMLGGLLLLGAAVLLGLVLILMRLPETVNGAALVLPGKGGRHTIDAAAIPVLGIGALLMAGPGLLALGLGRRQARFAAPGRRGTGRTRSFRRPVAVLCGGVALLVLVLLRH